MILLVTSQTDKQTQFTSAMKPSIETHSEYIVSLIVMKNIV